jgi:hypothetical protein
VALGDAVLARERTSPAATISSATPRMGTVCVACCAARSANLAGAHDRIDRRFGDRVHYFGKLVIVDRKTALIDNEIPTFDKSPNRS